MENGVFLTICANQILATLLAMHEENQSQRKPSQFVGGFRRFLSEAKVEHRTENILGEIRHSLERLPDAQRRLAIRDLSGMFGCDVALAIKFG